MLATDMKACTACRACEQICPVKCISIVEDENGFLYPQVDSEKCINCNQCNLVCHAQMAEKQILAKDGLKEKEGVFGHCAASDIVKQSSSGGAFSAIVDTWLTKNDIVVGAAYGEQFYVQHICCGAGDYGKLRKSKYVFSNPEHTYSEVKEYLNNGRRVMFTGTPCQIAGLKAFLKKDYENLLTMDFICHGVPSFQFLKNHILHLESVHKKRIQKIDFRSKKLGWKFHCFYAKFEDGSEYIMPWREDFYFSLFMNYEILRECCYSCQYSEGRHISDITVADFWGIERYRPESDFDSGESLLIANTTKGKDTIAELEASDAVVLHRVEKKYWEYVYKKHMYSLEKRNDFLHHYHVSGYQSLARKYQTQVAKRRIIQMLKRPIKIFMKK